MATLNTKIVLRNDTAENWLTHNPVLLAGEMGVETDTGLIKVGDGTKTWAALKYANKFENTTISTASHYEGTAQPIPDTNPAQYETDEEVIARVLNEVVANPDDVFIVKREIAEGKYSYTAYIHNGSNWKAMDGNYNADNIYFEEDFLATANIGVVKIDETTGSATIAAKGKNLSNVLASILAERKAPEKTDPSVTVKLTNSPLKVEAGTEVVPTYKTTFNGGKYTYGPATGIAAQTWTVKDNRSTPETKTTDSGSFSKVIIGDQTGDISAYSLTATATYNEGAMPVDNLGDPYEGARIPAGSASAVVSTSGRITCYRNYFYGSLNTTSAEQPLTSAVIRTNLTAGGAYSAATPDASPLVVNAGAEGAKRVVIAYPKNTTRGGLAKVTLPSTFNMELFTPATPDDNAYKPVADVNIEGADGYTAIPYTVYVYEPASIGSDEVHNIWLA
jgi:hypothetical protein